MHILQPDWAFLRRHPAHFVAMGLGSGLSPWAPGTAGTLIAIPLYEVLVSVLSPHAMWGMIAVSALLGVWVCDVTGRALGEIDHGGIVWDEIVAFWVVLMLTPPGIAWLALAFILFRVFDIWKPFPIGWLDRRIKNAWGVMLDDGLAAVYTVAALKLIQYLW